MWFIDITHAWWKISFRSSSPSLQQGNYITAIKNREAISIEENYTFYHIQGLIYARRFRKFIQNADNYDFIKDQYEDFVSYLKEQKKLVVESYDKSIEKNYDNEYSYVAKMGFYFAVIRDYKSKFAADKKISELIKTEGSGEKRKAEIHRLIDGYTKITPVIKNGLKDLRIELSEDGTHCKLKYNGEDRYMSVLAKTPSDVRAGANNASEIIKLFY